MSSLNIIDAIIQPIACTLDPDAKLTEIIFPDSLIIRFFTEENFEYKNISNEPKIYLKISIKKKFNLIKFIELLNNNGIEYNYVIDDYSNITFYKIHDEFYNIYTKLIHINGNKIKKEIIDYYTIINSLVIYLSMFKNNLLQ